MVAHDPGNPSSWIDPANNQLLSGEKPLIFYESTTNHKIWTGQKKALTHTTELDARKAFNKAKRNLKKSDEGGTCEFFKVFIRTTLSKNEWMRLMLCDLPGACSPDESDQLFVRDLILSRERLGTFTAESSA